MQDPPSRGFKIKVVVKKIDINKNNNFHFQLECLTSSNVKKKQIFKIEKFKKSQVPWLQIPTVFLEHIYEHHFLGRVSKLLPTLTHFNSQSYNTENTIFLNFSLLQLFEKSWFLIPTVFKINYKSVLLVKTFVDNFNCKPQFLIKRISKWKRSGAVKWCLTMLRLGVAAGALLSILVGVEEK